MVYSDIDFGFKANPNLGNDISVKEDIESIRQSVLTILKTNHGEKAFNPLFGANLSAYLFENIDDITASAIASDIKHAIIRDEPRVEIINIQVKMYTDNNNVFITLTVRILSSNSLIDIETSVERIR